MKRNKFLEKIDNDIKGPKCSYPVSSKYPVKSNKLFSRRCEITGSRKSRKIRSGIITSVNKLSLSTQRIFHANEYENYKNYKNYINEYNNTTCIMATDRETILEDLRDNYPGPFSSSIKDENCAGKLSIIYSSWFSDCCHKTIAFPMNLKTQIFNNPNM